MKTILSLITISIISLNACKSGTETAAGKETTGITEEHQHIHDYACPMHPEVRGHEGERCPKCGMVLEYAGSEQADKSYELKMNVLPENPNAGQEVQLIFIPKIQGDDNLLVPLDVVHDKKIHLILVSDGLNWYEHIHPEFQSDGSYTVKQKFPYGGKYLLYADYKPSGGSHELATFEIQINGTPDKSKKITTVSRSWQSKNMQVILKPDGQHFEANKPIHFDAELRKNNTHYDVNNLQHYLAAKGHMVAIHLESKAYMHIHPEVEGTVLHFHTQFDKTGLYRIWLQFMDEGTLYTSDFTINVLAGKHDVKEPKKESVDSHNH
jgi:hypothetical protein